MLTDTLKKLANFAWLIGPSFLLWAAFPPFGEGSDCLFALAPLLWLSRRETVRRATRRWFTNGLFFWIATLSWMPAIVKNGGPWPLVVLGWFALAAYCAGYFALYGWLTARFWSWARDRDPDLSAYLRLSGVLVVEPLLWCGLELVRSRLFGGFAWNQLGVVPANMGFGTPAALGGVYLLSAVVVLVNGTFAGIAERVWKVERSGFPGLRKFGAFETLLAFALVMGIYSLAKVERAARLDRAAENRGETRDANDTGDERDGDGATDYLKVAMVQRNFPCVFQAREENPVVVYSNLLQNVALLKPDLVVLAESAMCEFGPIDQQGAVRFAAFVREQTGGAALLAGGTRFADGRTFNSAALYSPDAAGTAVEVYDKVHLVPFGEFIPGDKLFPVLQKLAPVGSCTPGTPRLLTLGQRDRIVGGGIGDAALPVDASRNARPGGGIGDAALPVGTDRTGYNGRGASPMRPQSLATSLRPSIPLGLAICFEDTDSSLMRRAAAAGARALVFITNDSWFSRSDEAWAHAWQATARAVETGLPVIRVGNSGVTGTVSPDGKAAWLLGPSGRPLVDRSGTMFDRVPLADPDAPPTFYVTWGDRPLAAAFALLLAAMLAAWWCRRRNPGFVTAEAMREDGEEETQETQETEGTEKAE